MDSRLSIGAKEHLQIAVFYMWKTSFVQRKAFTSTGINWDLRLAAVCEGLKKMDLARPSSSSRFQPSSFFSASKGFLNCTFWPTQSEMSEKTGSQGCVSVRKLNLRQKKCSFSSSRVSLSREGHFQWETISIKTPPPSPHPPPPP